MKVRIDREADAAYVALVDVVHPGESVSQRSIDDPDGVPMVLVDLDAHGRILGFEVLGASRILREETLRDA
ncbi:MAG: DUF2283 domain-containing protein [Curtobacterium sp.]